MTDDADVIEALHASGTGASHRPPLPCHRDSGRRELAPVSASASGSAGNQKEPLGEPLLEPGEAERLRTQTAEMEQDISWDDLTTGETWFSDRLDRSLDYEPVTAERSIENWRAHIHPDDHRRGTTGSVPY